MGQTQTESYEAFYEDTNLVLRRLKHGKLTEYDKDPAFRSVGNLHIAKSLHSENAGKLGFDRSIRFGDPDLETRFPWEAASTSGYAEWRFPGQGVAYADCGTFWYIGCLEHRPGHAKRKKRRCGRAECPVCSDSSWLPRAVARGTERVLAGLPHSYSTAVHVTVSSPPKTWSLYGNNETYLKMRRKAIKVAKTAGIHGGCLIFHPYRGNRKAGWRYAPHFHIIGAGWLLNYDRLKPKLKGWLVKNHGVRRGGRSIGGTLKYQLTHAGVRQGNHVATWFGSMAWNKLAKLPDPPAAIETCPVCGGLLHRLVWYGTGDNPFNDSAAPGDGGLEIENIWWNYAE